MRYFRPSNLQEHDPCIVHSLTQHQRQVGMWNGGKPRDKHQVPMEWKYNHHHQTNGCYDDQVSCQSLFNWLNIEQWHYSRIIYTPRLETHYGSLYCHGYTSSVGSGAPCVYIILPPGRSWKVCEIDKRTTSNIFLGFRDHEEN